MKRSPLSLKCKHMNNMLRGCLVECEYLELNALQLKKLYPASTAVPQCNEGVW